jgi:hypothetical protein
VDDVAPGALRGGGEGLREHAPTRATTPNAAVMEGAAIDASERSGAAERDGAATPGGAAMRWGNGCGVALKNERIMVCRCC